MMSFIKDMLRFIRERKKWWLAVVIAAILLLGLLIHLSSLPAAPFVYTLF